MSFFKLHIVKPGSQYDAGAASVTEKKSFFHHSNCIPDVKFFDNLIGWTLANAHDATLELKLSLFQRHPDACDATLARIVNQA